ncbi:MAG: potassium/proton antiporter [Anaerolineaceae bacterium]|nr:potassium/proton antiporter [Anaerolineaceae bacterium]
MPITIEPYLVAAAVLFILSVMASKVSDRFGIPALIIFLGVGMLAGSDGIGGIYFDDPSMAQYLGVVALVVILFSGGLDTSWKSVRPVMREGLVLATLGVLLTAVSLGFFAHWILKVELMEGILLGAIVSSTDAAAVFAILRSKGIQLSGKLQPLLELESGSNDPMAVFLTVALTQLVVNPDLSPFSLIPYFLQQMILGLIFGLVAGKLALLLINRLRLGYAGLYPVLILGVAFLVYGAANMVGGSGFLAVYVAGVIMGRDEFLHKRSVLRFFDGVAWLMQIAMFLTLGLLVFPSQLGSVALPSLAIALFLMFVARPVGVHLSLLFSKFKPAEKWFISWVGLRGAVPIILATYPRILGMEDSNVLFNVVFFVVLTSVLLQGTSIPWAAKLFKVEGREQSEMHFPVQFDPTHDWKGELKETNIPKHSPAVGKAIFELGLPPDYLVVLIARGEDFVIPSGSVVLEPGDTVLGLAEQATHEQVALLLQQTQKPT